VIGGQDERHAEFLRGADLVLHDAQYTAKEYPAKIGWGHSPVQYAVRIAQHAGVAKIALTHHDPLRDDKSLDLLVENLSAALRSCGSTLEVFAAAEGLSMEVEPRPDQPHGNVAVDTDARSAINPAHTSGSVVLSITDPASTATFAAAVEAEKIPLRILSDPSAILEYLKTAPPSLVVLDHSPPRVDGLAICKAIRNATSAEAASLPVILLADREDVAGGEAAGVTEWIVKPFSSSYIRTKVRAWTLRTACRWLKAPLPEDEESRLRALKSLGILDTGPEARFDRITRLAAALFDVPIALISLVDWDRQWCKSCCGLQAGVISRDESFCAHVVHDRQIMVVPDTLRDPRFADNPLVTNQPRVRFYAGAPLILDDGKCVGTLCMIDTRVRSLEGPSIGLLQDLRDLAVRELEQKTQGR